MTDLTQFGVVTCPTCGDSGYVDDPGPHPGCWESTAYCMCPAGRAAEAADSRAVEWDEDRQCWVDLSSGAVQHVPA